MDLESFEKRLHSGGKGDAFSYDALKRFTNVTFDSPTPETPTVTGVKSRAITLDKLDNILKITDNESAMVTEIIGELEGKGKALNQYSKFNDLPLEYDTNGNLSAKGSRLFSYDYQNRLIRSSRGDDAVTFTYDIFGRQTSRTDLSGTLHFSYAGDQKIEERNASGQVTKHYLWGNGIDELLRLDIYNGSSSTPYYVHTDAIGSTTAITDGSGNLVERVTYDVYGAPTFTDALGQTLKKSTIRNTTLFQGREYDYDLSFYNYRARYFDPSLGRFLQTDPLGYQDSMNLYQGMGMNPVNFVDPTGEDFIVSVEKWRGEHWGHLVLFYQGRNRKWNRFEMGPASTPHIESYVPAVSSTMIEKNPPLENYKKSNDGVTLSRSFKTTVVEDIRIEKSVNELIKKTNYLGEIKYNPVYYNCKNAVIDVITNAKLPREIDKHFMYGLPFLDSSPTIWFLKYMSDCLDVELPPFLE